MSSGHMIAGPPYTGGLKVAVTPSTAINVLWSFLTLTGANGESCLHVYHKGTGQEGLTTVETAWEQLALAIKDVLEGKAWPPIEALKARGVGVQVQGADLW